MVIGMKYRPADPAAYLPSFERFPIRHAHKQEMLGNPHHLTTGFVEGLVRQVLQNLAADDQIERPVGKWEGFHTAQNFIAGCPAQTLGGAIQSNDMTFLPQSDRRPAGPAARIENRATSRGKQSRKQLCFPPPVRQLQRPPVKTGVQLIRTLARALVKTRVRLVGWGE